MSMGWLSGLGLRRTPHQRLSEGPSEDDENLLLGQTPPHTPTGTTRPHAHGPVNPTPEPVGGWRFHGITGTVGSFGQQQVAESETSLSVVEKEQLAQAIRNSLKETGGAGMKFSTDQPNEELDRALAMAIQEEERRQAAARTTISDSTDGNGFPPTFAAIPEAAPHMKSPRRGSRGKNSKEQPKGPPADQIKTDEDFARELQQQLNMQDPGRTPGEGDATSGQGPTGFSFPISGTHSLPATPPSRASKPRSSGSKPPGSPRSKGNNQSQCARCKLPLGFGRYLNCLGRPWHPQCFRCSACDKVITEQQFSVAGNDPFHSECYRRLFQPKCVVCHDYIPANADGLIEYRSHPFWKDKYCPFHEEDGTIRCCGCERLEPKGVQYADLDDGRKVCLDCLNSVIVDTNDCQPLYEQVLEFYKGLGMTIKQQIPMLCVERQALNAAREGEKGGTERHHHPETRGLCLSEEQTIRKVVRRPRILGMATFAAMETQYETVRRHCDVTAVLVLYGLPRVLTGSILAHELMHAYIRLDGQFPRLAPEVEEGIAQVMAHLWLQAQQIDQAQPQPPTSPHPHTSNGASSFTFPSPPQTNGPSPTPTSNGGGGAPPSSSSAVPSYGQNPNPPPKDVKDQLAEFVMHQIAMDSSPVYGAGFRAGHAAVVQFGLVQTLDHIRLTGAFPVPTE